MKALLILLTLAATLNAATVHIAFEPTVPGHADVVFTATEPVELVGIQVALQWDDGSTVNANGYFPSFFGPPLYVNPGGPNEVLDDGDAMLLWAADLPPGGPILVSVGGVSVFDVWFDPLHGSTVELSTLSDVGLETKCVPEGGGNLWDGELDAITLPEPSTVMLLIVGGLLRKR